MAYKVKSVEDLIEKVRQRDPNLAWRICEAILANIDTGRKYVHVVTVEIEGTTNIYDLSCNVEDFIVTLEKNLEILIENEYYEYCQEVVDGIQYLKIKTQNK